MPRVEESPPHRIAASLYRFALELMEREHVSTDELPPALRVTTDSPWVEWSTYIAALELLGERSGPAGIGRAMRAVAPSAYAEIRAMYRLFPDLSAFFSFFTQQVMSELNPCVTMQLSTRSANVTSLVARIDDRLPGSRIFHEGTKVLIEIFPTHAGLPEAKVDVVSLDDRQCALLVRFPPRVAREPERALGGLTPRESEVLGHVCKGLSNPEIAKVLGTSHSTVKNQVSSILAKVGALNRTELAVRASR